MIIEHVIGFVVGFIAGGGVVLILWSWENRDKDSIHWGTWDHKCPHCGMFCTYKPIHITGSTDPKHVTPVTYSGQDFRCIGFGCCGNSFRVMNVPSHTLGGTLPVKPVGPPKRVIKEGEVDPAKIG